MYWHIIIYCNRLL